MKLISILCVLFLTWLPTTESLSQSDVEVNLKIKKIRLINDSWYVIYAKEGKQWYKIISEKKDTEGQNCNKLKAGKKYPLSLVSFRKNAPVVNGVKIDPMNTLDAPCWDLDGKTQICLEARRSIFDLHFSPDLLGICLIDQ
jgi:hypothetical protein